MAKKRGARAKPTTATPFFDRFRGEVGRYAVGVHLLGGPAPAAALAEARARFGAALPAELLSFLESWNGAELFHESSFIAGVGPGASGGQLGAPELPERGDDADERGFEWAPGLLPFARAPGGTRLALDAEGRVWGWDDDEEELVLEASGFERWLDAMMMREGLVMDREGEYREEAFDEDDLTPAIELTRELRSLAIDPGSVAAALRLALAQRRTGKPEEALATFEALVARGLPVPDSGVIELARTAAALGQHERALAAARELAAGATAPSPRVAILVAEAARWARDHEQPAAQAELAARARELSPDVLTHLREGGAYELEAERFDAARGLLETARALAPRDLAVLDLVRKLPPSR